jgi:hypothetical protein
MWHTNLNLKPPRGEVFRPGEGVRPIDLLGLCFGGVSFFFKLEGDYFMN